MEFKIETEELQYIVKLLSYSAASNTTEAPGRILIEARKNDVLFLSNNGSVITECIAKKCKVKDKGSASIIFGRFQSFILPFDSWNGHYGSKEVRFKTVDKTAESAVYVYVANTMPDGSTFNGKLKLDIWPIFDIKRTEPLDQAQLILNCGLMKAAARKVVYAINPQEVREYLQHVKIDFTNDSVTFVGTNGVLLSEYEMKNINEGELKGFSARYDFISVLDRALPADDTQLFVEPKGGKIKVKFNDVFIEGRMDFGREYPVYKPTLNSFSNTLKLDKKMLMSVLIPAQGALESDDNHRFTIDVKNRKLRLYSDNVDFKCNSKLDYDGEFIIDVNGRLLKQVIENIHDDVLLMKFSDDKGVLIFDSGNEENQKSLMTPIRRR